MNATIDPVSLALGFGLLSLVPVGIIVCTSFLKISAVLLMLRNALGVQQIPPNVALYALALILSAYVMAPVGTQIFDQVSTLPQRSSDMPKLLEQLKTGAEPVRGFMMRNSRIEQRRFFVETTHRLWGPEMSKDVKADDFLVLMPAFLVSQINAAFEIGFLLYLPFVIIDLVVSNILLAMGMMMVSPVMISLPLKLFLFIMLDGWTRLIQGLVLSYA
ncbi:type III secretion system protein SsaR [Pandoraea iniqua]|uniref:Type III secretion system protein SsaR n=1 Tax=Pandoraea iniqua TaxID=2508288 RepID=A0A5E4YH84_9BURK|nr:type III secretion system export apparatus subunit SctR [Pandoraea iniqua]VVE48196.1 type III secretion system protein SsaR [Pandoraea iniqua]